MKTVFKFAAIAYLILLLHGCSTEYLPMKALDEIPTVKYYSNDIIPDQFANIYGSWKVTGTSGGISGAGFKKQFDYLILKKNAIFGIVRNDSLIAYGKLILLPETDMYYQNAVYCKFDFENPVMVELYADQVKYIYLKGKDSLDLIAPCYDLYNNYFIREK